MNILFIMLTPTLDSLPMHVLGMGVELEIISLVTTKVKKCFAYVCGASMSMWESSEQFPRQRTSSNTN